MSPTEVKRQAKGLRLIDPQPDHRPLSTLDLTAAQAGAHRRQSCHAVYLERSHGKPRLGPLCTQPDLAAAGGMLGLTPTADRWGQKDWRAAITEYAAADGDRMVKAALLTACTWAEAHISPHSPGYDGPAAAYIAVLATLGHTPDPYEAEHIHLYRP